MSNIFSKFRVSGFIFLSIVFSILVLNYLVLSVSSVWPFEGDSVFTYTITSNNNFAFIFFVYALRIGFYTSLLLPIVTVITILRERTVGLFITGILFLAFGITTLIFQFNLPDISVFSYVLVSIFIGLSITLLVIAFIRTFIHFEKDDTDLVDKPKKIEMKKELTPLEIKNNTKKLLVLDFISVVIYLLVFFIPLYTIVGTTRNYSQTLVNVLFGLESDLMIVIIFFLFSAILFFTIVLLMNTFIIFKSSEEKFIKQSQRLMKILFISISTFFVIGLGIKVFSALFEETQINIISYIPLILIFIVYFIHSYIIGVTTEVIEENNKKIKKPFYNIESLVFLFVITGVTIGMLLLPIIRIEVASDSYGDEINMTGIELLQDYATLDGGFQILAFVLHVMILVVGFALVLAVAAYLSKSRLFHSIVKTAAFTNVFFVFMVSVSGYYFMIAKEINLELLRNLIDHYNAGFIIDAELYDYDIKTDTIFALFVSIAVLIIMLVRGVFDREELPTLNIALENAGGGLGEAPIPEEKQDEEEDEEEIEELPVVEDFDPCYSFTEIDLQKEAFEQDLKQRQQYSASNPSLDGLTTFIVDYAKNSRLHLSYTKSKIAAFVAGLGASKLSILQGMSGTGKTSLPKIFSEAILANCEIVEVESSWKDKNELLGYYNEFSLKYTPKKFTISLYKASMNKDIFTFILLDEMNLSRIEYYFSDFLSLMEHEEGHRQIKLINLKLSRQENGEDIEYLALDKGHTLKVPANVWFIGTANRDESTFVISDKVYDRATTMNFTKRAPKVRDFGDPIDKQFYDYKTINKLLNDAKEQGTFDAENSEIIKRIELLLSPYNISFGNRILKQIEDFVNIYKECFKDQDVEHEAIETILLSKVVSKLEIKTIEDKDQLQLEFEKLNLFECAEFIKLLDDE